MSSIEQQSKGKKDGEIRYLTPLNIDTNKKKKYCMFQKSALFFAIHLPIATERTTSQYFIKSASSYSQTLSAHTI